MQSEIGTINSPIILNEDSTSIELVFINNCYYLYHNKLYNIYFFVYCFIKFFFYK